MQKWWQKAITVCGFVGLATSAGCVGDTVAETDPPGALLRLTPEILQPMEPFSAPLVAPGGTVVVKLVKGALPDGLRIDDAGTLRGTPTSSGQLARFTVRSENAFGEPAEQMDHVAVVGVRGTTLAAPTAATRTGDVLRFEHDWGKTLLSAWAWDPQLGLVWPMRAGAGYSGSALAPAGRALSLVATGVGAEGLFEIDDTPADESMQVIAQLTWEGDADIDLLVVPQIDSASGLEIGAKEPVFERDGQWLVRHEIGESSAPGPEVLTFSKHLPIGRWVFVAAKADGADIEIPMWLAIRRRDGLVLAERSYDALLSDVSTGRIDSDLAAKTQSFKPLGVLVVGTDREVSFQPLTDSDLYGAIGPGNSR